MEVYRLSVDRSQVLKMVQYPVQVDVAAVCVPLMNGVVLAIDSSTSSGAGVQSVALLPFFEFKGVIFLSQTNPHLPFGPMLCKCIL